LFLGGGIVTFWTDAIWYRSVGFDSVFWTRVLTQLGLFVGMLVVALIALLGNLWLAGRSLPAGPGGGRGLSDYVERWANAARTAPGPVRPSRSGCLDRPDLQPRHRILPLPAAVPAAAAIDRHEPADRVARDRCRAVRGRPARWLDRGHGPGQDSPRGTRRPADPAHRGRLSARQARARVLVPRRGGGRELHRQER